jgi:phosphotransferase system HPr (HPr) family protein
MPASSDPPGFPLSSQERGSGGEVSSTSGSGDEVTRAVTLPAAVALHARPAADLVRTASRLQAQVTIAANGKRANARSILEVLALGAVGGTELTLSASGPGAADAVLTLADAVLTLAEAVARLGSTPAPRSLRK